MRPHGRALQRPIPILTVFVGYDVSRSGGRHTGVSYSLDEEEDEDAGFDEESLAAGFEADSEAAGLAASVPPALVSVAGPALLSEDLFSDELPDPFAA